MSSIKGKYSISARVIESVGYTAPKIVLSFGQSEGLSAYITFPCGKALALLGWGPELDLAKKVRARASELVKSGFVEFKPFLSMRLCEILVEHARGHTEVVKDAFLFDLGGYMGRIEELGNLDRPSSNDAQFASFMKNITKEL